LRIARIHTNRLSLRKRSPDCRVSSDLKLTARSRNPDRFRVREFANAGGAQFATEAGAFYAAEWQTRIGGDHRIDENHAAVQLRCEKFLLSAIIGPRARAQPERRVIGELDSRVGIARAENSCNWAEDFFAVRRRVFRHIDENRGLIEKSRPV